jgi:small subunit ribosomal protein S17
MPKTKTTTENTTAAKKRELTGKVVSDKMKDTCVVLVERFVKVPKYQKYVTRTKRYKAHNPGNTKKIGDRVTIQECRPMSKDKHFIVVENA